MANFTRPTPAPTTPDRAKGDAFISAAGKQVKKGDQVQITVAMPAELLGRLDASAEAKGLGRAALVRMALIEYLNREASQ